MRQSRKLAVLGLFALASCSYEKSDLLRAPMDGGPGKDASPSSEAGSPPGPDSAGADVAVAVDGPGTSDAIVMPSRASCQAVALLEKQLVVDDGDYTLFVAGDITQPFPAYCDGMASSAPKTYLTVDRAKNYSSYGTEVTTRYSRIRFDPDKLLVDVADRTFAKTDPLGPNPPVESMAYGTAACCDSTECGVANVDLGELPFIVTMEWQKGGTNPVGSTTPSSDQSSREIRGGGTCGWNGPVSRAPSTLEATSTGWWDLQLVYQNRAGARAPHE